MHSFSTERLIIRPLEEQDKELFCQLYTDAKTMRNICPPLSLAQAEKTFARTLKQLSVKKQYSWAIISKETNQTIGIEGLTWIKEAPEKADIGIMLLRSANGRLLPEEAIGALLEYGFNNLKLQRIFGQFTKKNLASKRIVTKVGFIFEDISITKDYQQTKCYIEQKHLSRNYISDIK